MPVKIKRSQRKLIALTLSERAKPKFFRLVDKFIKEEMIKSIESGRSPVQKGGLEPKGSSGKLRFQQYSDSYKEAIKSGRAKNKKNIRPVNLKATGKMLRSIKSRKTKDFIRVWFTDEKAKYHDKQGAGKSKTIRRMAPNPKKGEKFNAGIQRRIVNALKNAIKLTKKRG